MSPGGSAVRVADVVAGYRIGGVGRRRTVLRGVCLELAPGSVSAVVGANGAGKTTLLRVVLGFMEPWSGSVTLDGVRPAAARRRRGIAYLPEAVELPAGWSVRALLREGARLGPTRSGMTETRGTPPADPTLEPWLERRTSELSRGITRRVALAFALAGEPPLLVLDEPFAGLDPPSREALAATVRGVRRRSVTVLMATHDLDEADRIADHILVLGRGLALDAGPPGTTPRQALLSLMAGEVRS